MKTDRLVSIILLLLDKNRISAKELAAMYEVSLRTIYRDIDAINMAGIPIRALPGVNGGFEIMEQYKIDKKVFSTTDLSTILTGLTSMSGMMRGEELVNTLTKVKSFIPAEQAKDIEVHSNQIYVDLDPWMENSNIKPYLEIIQKALQESKLLSFSYIKHIGDKTNRTVEPYQLVLKGNHWYLYGYCYIRNDFRLFKLSRITDLQLQKETFEPREYEKPQLDMERIVENMQQEITIRIHKSVVDRVLDYCSYEHFTPDGDEYYLVRFPFILNDYYYDVLLSLGSKCECIEPQEVRDEMRRRIEKIVSIYS